MKKAKLVVVSLWLVAITYMIIHLLNRTVYYIFAIIAMIFCLLFTSCNYIAIGRMLQRSHVRTQAYYHIHTGQQNRIIFSIRRYKKTMTTMLYVYGVFLLCYLPYLRFTLTRIHFERSSTIQGVNLITSFLVDESLPVLLENPRDAPANQATLRSRNSRKQIHSGYRT